MTLIDPITERRLLASLIVEPRVLEIADELEERDFSDPRCWYVLRAIRRLRADGADVGLDEIDREIQLQDMDRQRSVDMLNQGTGAYADKAGFWFLVEAIALHFAPYRAETTLIEHDMAWLRTLADRRRELTNRP